MKIHLSKLPLCVCIYVCINIHMQNILLQFKIVPTKVTNKQKLMNYRIKTVWNWKSENYSAIGWNFVIYLITGPYSDDSIIIGSEAHWESILLVLKIIVFMLISSPFARTSKFTLYFTMRCWGSKIYSLPRQLAACEVLPKGSILADTGRWETRRRNFFQPCLLPLHLLG